MKYGRPALFVIAAGLVTFALAMTVGVRAAVFTAIGIAVVAFAGIIRQALR